MTSSVDKMSRNKHEKSDEYAKPYQNSQSALKPINYSQKDIRLSDRKIYQHNPFDIKKSMNGMDYYKVQSNIKNFLPNIRFERDKSLTTPMSQKINNRQSHVSQSRKNLESVYTIDGKGTSPEK